MHMSECIQVSIAKALYVACALMAWSRCMVCMQCHRRKCTAQLGRSRQMLQVCTSEVESEILAVRCLFLNCLSLSEHAEHARPAPNKLCLHSYIIISCSFRLECFPAQKHHDCHASRLAVLHGASCCNAVPEVSPIALLLMDPGPYFVPQIGLAIMYANYWSLLSPLCRWLLMFQVCLSLHCTAQAPFLFQFQMFSMSRRRGRTMT